MILCKHVCLSKYIGKTIFVDFSIFYGILFKLKGPTFKSQNCCFSGFSGRPDGRPSSEVGRPSSRPNARTCTPRPGRWSVDRTGRPSRELCSLEMPWPTDRSTGQRACSLYLASVDRPVDRWHNSLKYDRRPGGRPTVLSGLQRLVFGALYIGHLGAVFSKILRIVLG